MIITTDEDIEAPIDFVFAQLLDFAAFEQVLRRRGVEIQCRTAPGPPAPGMVWDAAFDLRGKRREVEMMLLTCEPPVFMRFELLSKSLNGDLAVDLVALSRWRTRLHLSSELKPQNLAARLLVQSLKLARDDMSKRLDLRVADYARELENKYRGPL